VNVPTLPRRLVSPLTDCPQYTPSPPPQPGAPSGYFLIILAEAAPNISPHCNPPNPVLCEQ